MAILTSEKIIEYIPNLFQTNLNNQFDIFKKLEKVIKFNNGFIYFVNPDSLQLKYIYLNKLNSEIEQTYKINNELKSIIFSDDGYVLSSSEKLITLLELDKYEYNSFVISKLKIKSTVFGLVILAKNEPDFYQNEDVTVLNSVVSILSYVLKDRELSDVFKMQLKALKDGIVEKNNAYKTIKEQNEKILEADKIKNEFLANISHELRTPLNSILGFADILSAKLYGELNSKQEEYINDIKASGTHLLGMINEILDMSKIEANAMKIVKSRFWISRSINEAKNILMPLAHKKNITINTIINEDFEVFADYQKIQQILYNLVSNAVKYSPENDEVDISVFHNDESYRIEVHDNGIGIDPKYHGKIFAKFVQLDNAYTKKESSTGLGLTITKELVELHEGKISLLSEINNGSTFIVEIPF